MKIAYFILALFCLASGLPTADAADAIKPNIIVIFRDDHGYADLGCMGIMNDVQTPNIDALARGGVRMTDGYVTAPQCGPSRCGLISGQYQTRFGMEANGYLKDEVLERFQSMQTLPKRLKSARAMSLVWHVNHISDRMKAKA